MHRLCLVQKCTPNFSAEKIHENRIEMAFYTFQNATFRRKHEAISPEGFAAVGNGQAHSDFK